MSTFLERAMAKKLAQQQNKPVSAERVEPTLDQQRYSKPVVRDRDQDMEILELLLDCDITPWEKTFCGDVLRKMKAYAHMELSPKQAAVIDKLDKAHLEPLSEEANGDPTPKGNPPARFQTKKDVGSLNRNLPRSTGFDDMDDDIPF